MLALRNKERFTDLILLESETAPFVRTTLPSPEAPPPAKLAGSFASVDGTILCFFGFGGRIYFRADSQVIEVSPEVTSTHAASDGVSQFTLQDQKKTLFTFSYQTPDLTGSLAGVVAFVDEEDYDFCFWVHKVLENPERREIVRENWE